MTVAAATPMLDDVSGRTVTVTYQVQPADSVRAVTGLSPEFQRKPDIIGSGRMLEICESPCMRIIAEYLNDNVWSLGKEQWIRQPEAALVGATLEVSAHCVAALGPRTDWTVRVHDGHTVVALAHLGFNVKVRSDVERRIAYKASGTVATASEPPVDRTAPDATDLFCMAEYPVPGEGGAFVCVELQGHEARHIPHGDREGITWWE